MNPIKRIVIAYTGASEYSAWQDWVIDGIIMLCFLAIAVGFLLL